MSMPVRHLPVLQNWDCHSCGHCCRAYDVPVTDAERARIEGLDWKNDPDVGGLPLFVRQGRWSKSYHLFRSEKGCVFLGKDSRCILHERHGAEAKPLACRLFPFVLVPAGDHWRVGLRYGCPSAVANQGRSLTDQGGEAQQLADLLEKGAGLQGQPVPAPELQAGQTVDWTDLLRIVHALLGILRDRSDRLERRWRKCLALAALCRQARFDTVKGPRLAEFLQVLGKGLDQDVPADPTQVPAPGWAARVGFRQLLAVLGRCDRGELRGSLADSPWGRLLVGWRFARGTGTVPRLNALMPDTTFEQVETATGPLSASTEEFLERYYVVKVGSLQFFGPPCFGRPFWDGLEGLAVTMPTILWLARSFVNRPRAEAVALAVGLVDDHLGLDPILNRRRYRSLVSNLARRGEIAPLIACYSR
jgi:lysine-N-methylase